MVTGKGVPGGRKSSEEEEDIGRVIEVGAESTNGKPEWANVTEVTEGPGRQRYNAAVRSDRG